MPYPDPHTIALNELFETRQPRQERGPAPRHQQRAPPSCLSLLPPPVNLSSVDNSRTHVTSSLQANFMRIENVILHTNHQEFEQIENPQPADNHAKPSLARYRPPYEGAATANGQPAFKQFPWHNAFYSGAGSAAHSSDPRPAHAVVAAGVWDKENMAALAQHICSKGCTAERTGLADFVYHIYAQFHSTLGKDASASFWEHLHQHVLGTFDMCWVSTHPQSLRRAGTQDWVHIALNLSGFIGELFAQMFLPAAVAHQCKMILLREMTTFEHIEALRRLIEGAGNALWSDDAVSECSSDKAIIDFLKPFSAKAALLEENSSFLGTRFTKQDVQRAVASLTSTVHRFQWGRQVDWKSTHKFVSSGKFRGASTVAVPPRHRH